MDQNTTSQLQSLLDRLRQGDRQARREFLEQVCQRLQRLESGLPDEGKIGGSTYGFDIWPAHPCEAEVLGLLRSFRERAGELRARVEAHNRSAGLPREFLEVVSYMGQAVRERENEASEDEDDAKEEQRD